MVASVALSRLTPGASWLKLARTTALLHAAYGLESERIVLAAALELAHGEIPTAAFAGSAGGMLMKAKRSPKSEAASEAQSPWLAPSEAQSPLPATAGRGLG